MRYEFFENDLEYCWRVYLPFEYHGEYKWVQVMIFPNSFNFQYVDSEDETEVILSSIGNCDNYTQNYAYVNSSALGFWKSFLLSRSFENQYLSKKFDWKNTTPIAIRMGPLYSWTYNIYKNKRSKF